MTGCQGLLLLASLFVLTEVVAVEYAVHDMLGGLSEQAGTNAETDVCAFCHTPYGAVATTPGWNRSASAADALSAFATMGATRDGEDTAVGSVSLVCMSCHDGTQAMEVSGMSPHLFNGIEGPSSETQARWAARPVLPNRLNHDHPVGVPYAGGDLLALDLSSARVSARLSHDGFQVPERDEVNNVPVWWVETGGVGRQKTDLQLYTRLDTSSNTKMPFVECASCHDPHSKSPMLLRVDGDSAQLCTSCHML